jgi:ATP-binding protein involved in chromosome partitioning
LYHRTLLLSLTLQKSTELFSDYHRFFLPDALAFWQASGYNRVERYSDTQRSLTMSEHSVTEQQVLDALRSVIDPDLRRDIVSLGFVKDVKICDGNVAFKIELTTPACPVKDLMKSQATEAVLKIPGVRSVNVEMTANVRARQIGAEDLLPGVKHVIAVASGKGGVGKSTVSVNLAVALAQMGASVGLLDADVYGPSVPLMMGTRETPRVLNEKIIPIARYGVQMMSLGFLLPEDEAVVWRGPMVAGTVRQLLSDVNWGEKDYLVVDLPPGTGDAPMTLSQLVPITGVVIVMTPQDVAFTIAGKAVAMFRKLEEGLGRPIPLLGIIENMGHFVCPHCGTETPIFVGKGGKYAAERLGIPFLGSIPLDPNISLSGDEGVPAVVAYPESAQAKAFREIAQALAAQCSIHSMADHTLLREIGVIRRG